MNYQDILHRLCTAAGPSGFETAAVETAASLLMPLVDEVWYTRLGSVVGVRRCGLPGAKKLLLDAHLDEIGFVVTGRDGGWLRIAPLGGVDPRMLPNRELYFLTQPPAVGVVASMPPHLQSREEEDKALDIQELWVDTALDEEAAGRRFPIGTPGVYREECTELAGGRFCGKALDDRAGFAVLLDVLERLKNQPLPVDLYILGSTGEEVDSRGAVTAAYAIMPDYCVAVDVTHGDSPDAPKEKTFPLGAGPVVGIGPNCSKWMNRRLFAAGEALGISCQKEVMSGNTGTNAWPIQISREGVATAVLSFPLRYMHTPVEVACLSDLEQTAQLLTAFIQRLGEEDEPC